MNYAVLFVPDFALHALRRSDPSLCGRAVALVAGEGRKARVTEASPEARGVGAGARGDARDVPLPGDRPQAARARGGGRGPQAPRRRGVHACAARRVDRRRVLHRRPAGRGPGAHGGAHAAAGRRAGRGGAAAADRRRRDAAPRLVRRAVRRARPHRRRPGGLPERRCPLRLRSRRPSRRQILRGWGIATLGGLTALPKAEVGRRLGAEGALLWERAAGESTRVLRLVEPARSFAAEWGYEPPVESIEPLFFKLRRFAERIALELRGAGFVAEKLSLTLLLEDETDHRREFRLPEPGADVEGWLRVLNAPPCDGAHRCAGRGRAARRGPGAPAREAGGPLRRRPAGPCLVLGEPGARRRDRGRRPGGDARPARHPPAGRVRHGEARRGRGAPRGGAGASRLRAHAAPVPPAVARVRRLRAGPARPAGGRAARGPGARGARPVARHGRLVEAARRGPSRPGRSSSPRAASTSSPARRAAGASRECWTRETDGLRRTPCAQRVLVPARRIAAGGPRRRGRPAGDAGPRALRPRRRVRGRAAPHVREGGGRAGPGRVRAHDGGRQPSCLSSSRRGRATGGCAAS